jgi:uncharacterized protein YjiK
MKIIKIIGFFCVGIGLIGCTQTTKSPQGYDLSQPQEYKMPIELHEISGIVFQNNHTLLAQQDEDGNVYTFKVGDDKTQRIVFGKSGDFEDIGFYENKVVVLRSDGRLYLFSLEEVSEGEAQNVRKEDLLDKGEYEALYVDEQAKLAYVLCKDCPGDSKKEVKGYKISLSPENMFATTSFMLDTKSIEKLNGGKKINLKVSAIAKNPKTKEWFILSAVNKMLLIADPNWNIKELYDLPAANFIQPEGIAFDQNNNLYISNEGAGLSSGTILKFEYKGN